MDFYTSVQCLGNNILLRGIKGSKRIKEKIQYQPTLYEKAKKKTGYEDLFHNPLLPIVFDDIRTAKDYLRQYEDVEGKEIFGNTRFEYAYIADNYKGHIEWEFKKVVVGFLDIEVSDKNGFPEVSSATEEITAITINVLGGETYTFGIKPYKIENDEVYYQSTDEHSMLKKFLEIWNKISPDVVTGWNVKFFDIPYLYNRIKRILGDKQASTLSPWGFVSERTAVIMGRKQTSFELYGCATLDYLELYKWYSPNGKSQESYRLDSIAFVELGERKISYDEYGSLHELYTQDYQKFIRYNIRDVHLVLRIDQKLKLVELALTLAYDTKSNYEDVFAQTRMWDALTYNHLLERNIIVPPKEIKEKDDAFEGAYVKDPQIGMHRWVASFDLDSLYPHLMMQYNISPETLIEPEDYTQEMRETLAQTISVDNFLQKKVDTSKLKGCAITPNGQLFRTDVQGFLPKMLFEMYEDRKKFKKMMLDAKQEFENEKDAKRKASLESKIARLNNLQLAKKVSLNSAYGATGSKYFRFFDLRLALGVTLAGQLSIRWIENKLNIYLNKLLETGDVDYIIASDTDSIYLRMDELLRKFVKNKKSDEEMVHIMDKICEERLKPYIDKSYEELAEYVHAFEQKMRMKREALANKAIWTSKKRYILNVFNNEGVQYAEPHIKVMGLEMVKSSTPFVIRKKMEEAIRLMLNGEESDIHQFVEDFRKEFKKLPAEEISFPRGLGGLAEYKNNLTIYSKGTPIHIKGALLYNDFITKNKLQKKYALMREGDKIKFTYLKVPNPMKDTVISFQDKIPEEMQLEGYVDYDTQFEKTFEEPLQIVLTAINWNTEKVATLWD